jgi:hypothetical protein
MRIHGLILAAAAVLPLGCDSSVLDPGTDPGAESEPVIESFGGVLSGTAPLAAGLDPALLRVAAFRTRQEVSTELDNGDLGHAEMVLSVGFGDVTAEVLSIGPNPPSGVARYLFEASVPATVEDDQTHPWSLVLPEVGEDDYVVLGWYDEDGDGTLALTLDGEGSEYSVLPTKAEPSIGPDARVTLELVWWHEQGKWIGTAAGRDGDGMLFEESLFTSGSEGWETEVAAAGR